MKVDLSFDNDPRIDRFLRFVGLYCETNDVSLHFSMSKRVRGCSGLFYDDPPLLMIAIGKKTKDWLQILVHEFSHCIQWNEDPDKWNLTVVDNGVDAYSHFQDWYSGERELNKKEIGTYATLARLFEQDCDMKAVHLIKTWKLPFDVDEYIQRSNAYHIFYEYIKETRQWYPNNKAPYEVEHIWKNMPSTWVERPTKSMIDLYREVYS